MIDLFIVVLLGWAAFSGWRAGFIKELISSVGFLVGLFIAATCYSTFSESLAISGTETNIVTNLIAFFLLWIIVPIVLGFAANILTKALKGMKLGMPNSILGALVSFLKYFILLSCVLNVMRALGIMNEERTASSHLYTPVTETLQLFFPEEQTVGDSGKNADTKADTVWIDMTGKKPAPTQQTQKK